MSSANNLFLRLVGIIHISIHTGGIKVDLTVCFCLTLRFATMFSPCHLSRTEGMSSAHDVKDRCIKQININLN